MEESKEVGDTESSDRGGAICANRRHRSSAHVAPVTAWHARKTRAAQRERGKKKTHQQETAGSPPEQQVIDAKLA